MAAAKPDRQGSEFDASDLAGFAKAYDQALDELNGVSGRPATIPPPTVRNLLMSRIFSEARKGKRNTERLKNAALGGIRDRLGRNPPR